MFSHAKRVAKDGSCLFRSLCLGLNKDEDYHLELRQAIACCNEVKQPGVWKERLKLKNFLSSSIVMSLCLTFQTS